MKPSQGLVEVVKNVSSGRDQDIDAPVLEEVSHEPPHTRWNESAAHSHHDYCILLQHLEPDLMCQSQIAPLK
jgi:hypothetical protein